MKIPPEANRVFKGIIFDVYQWNQKMFDGTEEVFEALKRPNTIEIIAVAGNKILLSRQSQPNKEEFFSLFGGRAEENEEPVKTAQRELKEESGLESRSWDLYQVFEPLHKIEWKIYTFIARDCIKTSEQKLDSGEKIEVVSCSFDEFIDIVLSDKYWGNEFVQNVLRMKVAGTLETFRSKLFGGNII